MKKMIFEGGTIPRGYAPSWDDWSKAQVEVTCYPIGIHLIVRYTRRLYWWFVHFRRGDGVFCPCCKRMCCHTAKDDAS